MILSGCRRLSCRKVGALATMPAFVVASMVLDAATDPSKAPTFATPVRTGAGGALGETAAPYPPAPCKIAASTSDADRSSADAIESVEPKPAPAVSRCPTADEVVYVMACMQMNGPEAEGLRKCPRAINALEARLPHDHYKDAQLMLAMRQADGRNAGIFRDTAPMRAIVSDFIRAQKAANRRYAVLAERSNIDPYLENSWACLKARANGALGPGRPEKRQTASSLGSSQ
jgi:hypothetical protein